MRRFRFAPLLLVAAVAAAGPAQAIEGYPGDTWGRISHQLNDSTGTGISFFVNQGIDWTTLPGEITLNTFAEYRYSRRTQDKTYFDAEGEAVGIDLRRAPFHLGLERFWEEQTAQGTTSGVTRAYLSWYHDWYKYMRKRLVEDQRFLNINALSGSTWGRVRHEFDGTVGENTSVNFFVNQGIDWFVLPGDITFNTYVEPRFSYRSRDAAYYDSLGPAIGAELQRNPFRFGTDYFWEYYTERKVWERTWRLYFTWYYNWDLKNLGGD